MSKWSGIPIGHRIVLALTCPRCGLLKSVDHFDRSDGYVRRHSCQSCSAKKMRTLYPEKRITQVNRKRSSENARMDAPRKYRQWTTAEMDLCTREDLSAMQVAELTGRTLLAVYGRRSAIKHNKVHN